MRYLINRYCFDNTLAIRAYNDCEPYCDITVNLSDYGRTPESDDYIFIPAYKLDDNDIAMIMNDLVDEVVETFCIGYDNSCKILYVRLKDDWKNLVETD